MSWLRSHHWWLEEPGPKPGPLCQGLTWCSLAGKAVTTLGRTRPLTNNSPPDLSPVVKWAPLESHPLWVTELGCCRLAGVNSFTISPPEITAPRMWAPSRKEKKVQTGPKCYVERGDLQNGPSWESELLRTWGFREEYQDLQRDGESAFWLCLDSLLCK